MGYTSGILEICLGMIIKSGGRPCLQADATGDKPVLTNVDNLSQSGQVSFVLSN